jgi:hypothetical protein
MESWVSRVRELGLYSIVMGIQKGFKTGKRQGEICVVERSLLIKVLKS